MYLERADNVSRLLRLQSHLIAGSASVAGDDTVRWLAVLRSAGSAEAYSRYYSLRVEIDPGIGIPAAQSDVSAVRTLQPERGPASAGVDRPGHRRQR